MKSCTYLLLDLEANRLLLLTFEVLVLLTYVLNYFGGRIDYLKIGSQVPYLNLKSSLINKF